MTKKSLLIRTHPELAEVIADIAHEKNTTKTDAGRSLARFYKQFKQTKTKAGDDPFNFF